MSWRDRLRTASFRGASFKVESVDTQVGRRNVLHQYPGKEIPYLEDMGLDADMFSIVGYVIQNKDNEFDYFAERDTLIRALRVSGVGTLVHPFLGEFQVGLLGKVSITESFTNGGIATFRMTFVLAGEAEYPTTIGDITGGLDSVVTESKESVLDSFLEKYSVTNVADFISNSAVGDLQKFVATVYNYTSSIINKTSSVGSYILSSINTTKNQIESIFNTPENVTNMIDLMGTVFTDLLGITGDYVTESSQTTSYKQQVYRALINTTGFESDLDSISVNTSNRALQYRNRAAIVNYAQFVLLSTAAQIAVRIDYDSYEDAMALQELLTTALDDQLDKLGDEIDDTAFTYDDVEFDNNADFDALQAVRAAFVSSMQSLGADLARIVYYEVPYAVQSTLELAYSKYMDIDRADQIFDRNKLLIDHPGFLPEGVTIELLGE